VGVDSQLLCFASDLVEVQVASRDVGFLFPSGYRTDGREVNRLNHVFLLGMGPIMAVSPEMKILEFAADQRDEKF
jgi:hypothetical protein